MVQLLLKTVWQSLKILNIELLHNLAIPLPAMYQENRKHMSTQKLVHSSIIIPNSPKQETIRNVHHLMNH